MFHVEHGTEGTIVLFGRLDASQADKAKAIFENITESTVVDLKDLEYISSLGLGILFSTQIRLKESGHSLKLINMNDHIRDVFKYTSFDKMFEIG
jgi:anti-sigma B factor antagonist